MSKPNRFIFCWSSAQLVALLMPLGVVYAQAAPAQTELAARAEQGVSLEQAQSLAVEKNPTLKATLLELKRAQWAIVREQGSWDPLWSLDAGYNSGSSIALGRDGSATLISRDSLQGSAQVNKTFTTATQTRAQLSMGRAVSDSVAVGRLGTAYNIGLLLEVSQPWLRGFGREITEGALRISRAQYQASDLDRATTANSMLREVTVAYWELWYAQQALQVSAQGLTLAQQQLAIGQVRQEAGVLAREELLPLLSEVVSLEEELLQGNAQLRERALTLGRLLGRPSDTTLRASEPGPMQRSLPTLEQLVEQASARSPALKRLEAEQEQAKINAVLANDRQRLNLNTLGRLQVDGLGRDPAEAVVSFGKLTAVSTFVGISLAWPASAQAARAEAERAELAQLAIKARYQAQQDQLARELASRHNALVTVYERQALLERVAQLAEETVTFAQGKLEAGDATALDVVRVLQRQREARLRLVRLKTDLALNYVFIDELVGLLADELKVESP